MAFSRWGYGFEGAFLDANKLESRSGVYVIWNKVDDKKWEVLDVGESGDVLNRVLTHDRSGQWEAACTGTIYYSVTYTQNKQQAGRMEIEQRIRDLTNPPCGIR